MFDLNTEYRLTFGDAHDKSYCHGIVLEYTHPVIKFKDNSDGKEIIYNVSASNFLTAEKR